MNKPLQLLLAVILGVLGGIIVALLLVVLNQITLAHADSTMFFFNVGQGGAGGGGRPPACAGVLDLHQGCIHYRSHPMITLRVLLAITAIVRLRRRVFYRPDPGTAY